MTIRRFWLLMGLWVLMMIGMLMWASTLRAAPVADDLAVVTRTPIGNIILATPYWHVRVRPSPVALGTPAGAITDRVPRSVCDKRDAWWELCEGGWVNGDYFDATVFPTPRPTTALPPITPAGGSATAEPTVRPTRINGATEEARPGCYVVTDDGVYHFISGRCTFRVIQVP